MQKIIITEKQFKNVLKEIIAYHGGKKGIEKFILDKSPENDRLMGSGVYVTLDKGEALSYSKGRLYTVDIPDNDGSNYLDFTKPIPQDILDVVAEELSNVAPMEQVIKKGRMSLCSLLCFMRGVIKGDVNYESDYILNEALMKCGVIGHISGGSTYVIYDPDVITIIK